MTFTITPSQDYVYTSVLLDPEDQLLFLGTSVGLVEIWNIERSEKVAEVRYLRFDEFNEQIPIKDPVVNLAAPNDFSVVYAFMGVAAYCIDTKLKTIIQQIPVVQNETIVWGNVSPILGEICVLSTSGYLSRWSPKFFERTGAIEFAIHVDDAYVLHDYDESRVMIIRNADKIMLTNLGGEKYIHRMTIPDASTLIGSAWYDSNKAHEVYLINGVAFLRVNKNGEGISPSPPNKGGKVVAENQLRNDVLLALPQSNREYLKDTRLERQSVDRYLAELEKLEGHLDQTHIVTSNKEDSKTISFAFNEYYSGEIEKQSRSLALIKKIGLKHSLSADQLSYSWRRGHEDEEIIEFARYYQFEEIRRNKKIFQFLVVSLLLTLFHLIFPQIINFSSTLLILVLTNYLLLGTLLVLWRFTNKKPRLPDVEEYRAMRSILSLLVLVSGFLLFLRSDQTLI